MEINGFFNLGRWNCKFFYSTRTFSHHYIWNYDAYGVFQIIWGLVLDSLSLTVLLSSLWIAMFINCVYELLALHLFCNAMCELLFHGLQLISLRPFRLVFLVWLAQSTTAIVFPRASVRSPRCQQPWRQLNSSSNSCNRSSCNWSSCNNRSRSLCRSSLKPQSQQTQLLRRSPTIHLMLPSCSLQHQRTLRFSWLRQWRHRMRATMCLLGVLPLLMRPRLTWQ